MPARHLLASALLTAAAAAAVVLPSTSAVATPGEAAGRHDRAGSGALVAEVRKAIAPYRDVEAALAAGYIPVSPCESSPEGGMGIHYLNPALAQTPDFDPARPEVLLYAPGRDGGLQLLGAEFFQVDIGQAKPMLGSQPFDGPMAGHSDGMPVHYDLHVWTEVANPAGVFAPFNPKVACAS